MIKKHQQINLYSGAPACHNIQTKIEAPNNLLTQLIDGNARRLIRRGISGLVGLYPNHNFFLSPERLTSIPFTDTSAQAKV
jgi:hypothetical protein